MMDGTAQAQLRVIHRVVDVLSTVDVPVWLFGGWGLDARIGRITRTHGDIEFWVRRPDAARSQATLVDAGSTALATQPPEEACEFVGDDVSFSTAYFDRRADGTFALRGRWSDWVLPPDSFGEEPGLLDGVRVPVMSVAGMLAMKEQFPTLRNGRPWRDKDVGDIAVLRGLRSRPRGYGYASAARRRRPAP
jgi:lincosamide nucleotidyltransferase A/C/D/E